MTTLPAALLMVVLLVGCKQSQTQKPAGGAASQTAPGSSPYLFDNSDKAWELLEAVATDLGATVGYVASGADGGHSLNRSQGRGRFMAQSATVTLNGAEHYELVSRFMKALESDIQASGFELGSSSRPSDPAVSSATYDFYRSYTEPVDKAGIGEIRLWSTRMPDDRIRITVVGLDFP
jgi:hypothetical protein